MHHHLLRSNHNQSLDSQIQLFEMSYSTVVMSDEGSASVRFLDEHGRECSPPPFEPIWITFQQNASTT